MAITIITLKACVCERCAHQWIPNANYPEGELPAVCPKCKSALWNRVKRTHLKREAVQV